jgi:hypothetical protein
MAFGANIMTCNVPQGRATERVSEASFFKPCLFGRPWKHEAVDEFKTMNDSLPGLMRVCRRLFLGQSSFSDGKVFFKSDEA